MNRIGSVRWLVCGLVFFATTVNYVDRQVLALLNPVLKKEIGWTDATFGDINSAFQVAYGIGMLFAGRLVDVLGTRLGYSLSIAFWSVAAMLHATARSATGFVWARVGLGLGESGNFPTAIKTIAEWFPQKERALATGVMNAGTNVGATVAPILVPLLTVAYGWPAAFVSTGALGFWWLALWLAFYQPIKESKRLGDAERKYILADQGEVTERQVPWIRLLGHRQTWAFMALKAMTDPI